MLVFWRDNQDRMFFKGSYYFSNLLLLDIFEMYYYNVENSQCYNLSERVANKKRHPNLFSLTCLKHKMAAVYF